jgi:UbiD family decarboxylase
MDDKIKVSRRTLIKAAGLAGAAFMVSLHARSQNAEAVGPGFIKGEEMPPWYKPRDLRDFIKLLESRGELVRIKKEVDPKFEIGGYLWEYEQQGKAVLFENVKGSKIPVVGGLYQSWKRIGLSLGASGRFGPSEMYAMFNAAMPKPMPPQEVGTGSWKEVILKGDRIDLSTLPVPTLFEGDGGPYITAGIGISKNPETNVYNIGVYRMQITGKNQILVWAFPGSDLSQIYKAYEKMGKEMDFAVVIGTDPTIFATAVSKIPPEIDEMAVAGTLEGKGIEVTKAETIDLFVPASGEIVIEGKIDPKVRKEDGPFADHGGIYKGGPSPTLRVSAICHRKDPLFHVILSGDSMEHTTTSEILACFWGRNILDHLQSKFPSVKDANLYWSGGTKKWIVVSISEKQSNKEPQEIINEIFKLSTPRYSMLPVSSYLRSAIIVNEDVDIYDVREVIWAAGTRLVDCVVIEPEAAKGYELRIGLDSTKPNGAPADKYKRTKTVSVKL